MHVKQKNIFQGLKPTRNFFCNFIKILAFLLHIVKKVFASLLEFRFVLYVIKAILDT